MVSFGGNDDLMGFSPSPDLPLRYCVIMRDFLNVISIFLWFQCLKDVKKINAEGGLG